MSGSFGDAVRDVLSDTLNLPAAFLDYVGIQYPSQNVLATAKTSGDRIATANVPASVTATGTSFAAGTDILSSALEFTASGSNSYLLRISAPFWTNSTTGAANTLRVNLDGADAGAMQNATIPSAGQDVPCAGWGLIITPSAGEHSINVRFSVSAGTGTITGGPGGSGQFVPIVVTLEVA